MTDTKNPEDVRVGATIRALREAHELKTIELAAAVGISQPYLSNIEAGRKSAPMALCRKIARVLRVPVAAITIDGYDEIREEALAKTSAPAAAVA
jgi:transcriptional regulator with XRE-family HTH domain